MCGICGFVALAGRPDADALRRMADTLSHRGPDDEGFHLEGPVGLANRRLSIIDLPGGHQPVYNEDRTICVVFNGEIYNQLELRRELSAAGHLFGTRSDTEVLVHLYEEWGEEGVHRLNGMFAFALWDRARNRVWLVRDRLGVKPLYLMRRPDLFLFGSEAKALLAFPGVTPALDPVGLELYLTLRYLPESSTIFAGMEKLPPGQMLTVDTRTGAVVRTRYWRPEVSPLSAVSPRPGEQAEELLSLLHDAVAIRLMSDVPFGAFLSGGLDSSAVVALMSRVMSEPVKTFSIGFSEQGSLDETRFARLVAETFRTQHREIDCTADGVEALPRLIHHLDEPFADPIIVPTFQVAELAARHVKVVLTGEGADEVFGGYTRFVLDQRLRRLHRLPAWFRGLARLTAARLPFRLGAGLTRALEMGELPDARRFLAWVTAFTPADLEALCLPVAGGPAGQAAAELYERFDGERSGADPTSRMLYCDLKVRLPECMLARTDRMTMAVSLEGRTPFLDYRVVEWALRRPGDLHLRGSREKVLLKEALGRLLPQAVLARRKQGLAVPFALWTRHGVDRQIRRLLAPERVARRGLFRPEAVQHLLVHWGPHAARHSQLIWSLLCLELWCRLYLDRDLDPATPLSAVE
ncbi:MAG: asparagine synthase (glutamine-hydrolyzing), partial [Candidatus Latescibacterota bacterium]